MDDINRSVNTGQRSKRNGTEIVIKCGDVSRVSSQEAYPTGRVVSVRRHYPLINCDS